MLHFMIIGLVGRVTSPDHCGPLTWACLTSSLESPQESRGETPMATEDDVVARIPAECWTMQTEHTGIFVKVPEHGVLLQCLQWSQWPPLWRALVNQLKIIPLKYYTQCTTHKHLRQQNEKFDKSADLWTQCSWVVYFCSHSIDNDFGMKEMFPTTCSVPYFKLLHFVPPPTNPKVFKKSSDTPYIKIYKHASF
jgi:hypothetical protein